MKINLKELRESLTEQDIINIIKKIGEDTFLDKDDYILFPTICHNPIKECASMKLYYYKDSHMFHCYTECNENFDIFDLIIKYGKANGMDIKLSHAIKLITDVTDFNISDMRENDSYKSDIEKYSENTEINLEEYDKAILELFNDNPMVEWLDEGISLNSMKKFNILYYDYRHKIVIPHYDIDGRLIGIRGRALDELEAKLYGKYTPLKVQDIIYKHPLSFNLYGINKNKENIKECGTAIIFEGEKSVLKCDNFMEKNIAVASCGSNLNYRQIELLIKECQVRNIILAYDKEFETFASDKAKKYYNKLVELCKKYSNYCNFYILFDFNNLLEEKDSPVDKGKEIFTELLKHKVKVK